MRKKIVFRKQKQYNVVIFMMESRGAVLAFSGTYNATPNFDSIAQRNFTDEFLPLDKGQFGNAGSDWSLPTFSYSDIIGSDGAKFFLLGIFRKRRAIKHYLYMARAKVQWDLMPANSGLRQNNCKADYDATQVHDDERGEYLMNIFLHAQMMNFKNAATFCSVVFSLTSHSPYCFIEKFQYFSDTISRQIFECFALF